jgi:hypothetical protein
MLTPKFLRSSRALKIMAETVSQIAEGPNELSSGD